MSSAPSRIFCLAILALGVQLGLNGCSPSHAPAVAHKPAPSAAVAEPFETATNQVRAVALMKAIYGDAYDALAGGALARVKEGEHAGWWMMTLVSANDLPDGRTAVVANGSPSDEGGADLSAHASPGLLSVFVLKRAGSGWRVLERHEAVTAIGSSANIGSVKWVALGTGKPGFIVFSGGTWFGNSISNANIYSLDGGVRDLGGFAEWSSNEGACTLDRADCWEVGSKLRFVDSTTPDAPRDILADFSGRHYRLTEDERGHFIEQPAREVRQTARYHFDGKSYVLVAGSNPVPWEG